MQGADEVNAFQTSSAGPALTPALIADGAELHTPKPPSPQGSHLLSPGSPWWWQWDPSRARDHRGSLAISAL